MFGVDGFVKPLHFKWPAHPAPKVNEVPYWEVRPYALSPPEYYTQILITQPFRESGEKKEQK